MSTDSFGRSRLGFGDLLDELGLDSPKGAVIR